MAQIAWKQLDRNFNDDANYTGSLRISGSFFLDNQEIRDVISSQVSTESGESIFAVTGSYFSTTNNLQITGSFNLGLDGISDVFDIKVGGESKLRVNEEGTLVLFPQQTPPTAVTGGIYFDINNSFYLGQ